MVGRLVQKQQVVPFQHQLGQGHTPLFPSGQGLYRLVHILAGEQEEGQNAAHIPGLHAGERVPHFAHDGLSRMQPLLLLVVIPHIHIGTVDEIAASGFNCP